jgi:hypothetical protein
VSVEQGWKTRCHDCGKRGPEAHTAGASRDAAKEAGWNIGQRGQYGREGDYCPNCRHRVDREICDNPKDDGVCGSLAMYVIKRDNENSYVCGKHFAGAVRDLFYGSPKTELTVTRLRTPINHKR